MSTLATSIIHSMTSTLTDSSSGATWNRTDSDANRRTAFATGATADLANRWYESSRTLAASTSEDIDLYDFSGATNAVGETYALAVVKSIMIRNTSAVATTTITVGAAASNPWVGPFGGTSPTLTLTKGTTTDGMVMLVNGTGWTVTDAASHLLQIENNDATNAATYEIIVVGSQ